MVRLIASLVGVAFVFVLGIALFGTVSTAFTDPAPETAEHEFRLEPRKAGLASDGFTGKFDRRQVQRGFQVYKEVCAACHGLRHVAFRNLTELGFTEPEVKAIASQWATEVPSINQETGEAQSRKAMPVDYFPSPYANEVAARAANNNALPPDLSLMAKARDGGGEYIHSLLTGYRNPPANLPAENRPGQGLYYNPYFVNLNIAMPPPLVADGQVTYADGTPATIGNMSKDVSAFLIWAAEPRMENRKRMGLAVLIFLLIATTLAYFAYRNIWHGRAH